MIALADALGLAAERDEPTVVATIVRTSGPLYRRAGARLLIRADGSTIGVVSGGCLEADLVARAEAVFANGIARVLTYRPEIDDMERLWGLGIGCGGAVEILLARLDALGARALSTRLSAAITAQDRNVLSTLVRGPECARPGDVAWLAGADAPLVGFSAIPTALEGVIRSGAIDALERRRCSYVRHDHPLGVVEVAHEVVSPRVRLGLLGRGPDAAAVALAVAALGWAVVDAIDTACHAVVIMSHRFEADREALRRAIASDIPYIGVLGSRGRTEQLLGGIDRSVIGQRVYAPVGLDIGAETPEEIAVAIVAEIQAARSGRAGGMLRDRVGAIHVG